MNTKGAAGHSGLDAVGWWKRSAIVPSIHGKVLPTKKIYNEKHKSTSLEAYLSCCLFPHDKNPCVRPIGMGEDLRRIVAWQSDYL